MDTDETRIFFSGAILRLGRVFKVLRTSNSLISTGLQPGDAVVACLVSRFSGFGNGGKAVETAGLPVHIKHRAEARC